MGSQRAIHRRRNAKGLVALLLLLSNLSLHAQEAYNVRVEWDPQQPLVDEEIRLDIYVSGAYFPDLKVTEPNDTSKLVISEGPFIRPNISEKGIVVSYILRVTAAGKCTLNGFQIGIGPKTIRTDPITFYAYSGIDKRARGKTVAVWRLDSGNPLVGETVPVTLELTIWDRLSVPEEINVKPPQHAWFEEIPAVGQVYKETLEGRLVYVYPLKSFLLTPTRAGHTHIPSAKITFNSDEILYSDSRQVSVWPLPEQIQETGAIGEFELDWWIQQTSVTMGDDIVVGMRLSGRGNLRFLTLPVPRLADGLPTDDSQSEAVYATSDGYVGHREAVWRFRVNESGRLVCLVPTFRYYSPANQGIITIAGREFEVTVEAARESSMPEHPPRPDSRPRGAPEILRTVSRSLHQRSWAFLLFVPGPAVFALSLVWKRRWLGVLVKLAAIVLVCAGAPDVEYLVEEAVQAHIEGDYPRAVEHYLEAADILGANPALLYNVALCYYHTGEHEQALHFLRTALKSNPHDTMASALLGQVQTRMRLEDQLQPSVRVSPDYYFVALAIMTNIVFLLLALLLVRPSVRLVAPLSFAAILLMVALVLFTVTLTQQKRPTGIIAVDRAILTRIPEESAQEWLHVAKGASVRVLRNAVGYCFVQTGIGAEGWIPADSILLDTL